MASGQSRFTRAGYERLKNELDSLKNQRGAVIQDIKEAREQGDLRENHAYHAAKDAQGMLEARISRLEMRLDDVLIVEEGEVCEEVIIGVPVKVRLLDDGAGTERTYTIVPEEELGTVENSASEASPIGSALLGKKVGDIAEVQGPKGIVRFEILTVGAG